MVHATERDTQANRLRRVAFVAQLREIAPEDLIYLDESGVSAQMTRVYARAPRGRRIHDAVPGGHWKIVTILGAMDHNGMLATRTIEAATDREIFLAYLDEVLCPKLRPGHVVVMDNLSANKVEGVRERIEQAGALVGGAAPFSYPLHANLLVMAQPDRALVLAHHSAGHTPRKLQKCQRFHRQNRPLRPPLQPQLPPLRMDSNSRLHPSETRSTLFKNLMDTTLVARSKGAEVIGALAACKACQKQNVSVS